MKENEQNLAMGISNPVDRMSGSVGDDDDLWSYDGNDVSGQDHPE